MPLTAFQNLNFLLSMPITPQTGVISVRTTETYFDKTKAFPTP